MPRTEDLRKIATRLRIHSLRMTTTAGSGHPTTCLSAADLAACLFFSEMRWNTKNPDDPANDEFVLSKGHAAPLLWAVYAEAGVIPLGSLRDLRKISSDLEGHPTPRMPWVKAATGSLGQGLSVGVGMALAQKLDRSAARTFVLLGDGECAEGQVWEAAAAAVNWKLRHLVAVVDVNRLGQSDPTMHQHDLSALARKFRAFGWEAIVLDGHKIERILAALARAGQKGRPTALLARTLKGKGVSFVEDKNGWHGKPLKPDELARALEEIGCLPDVDAKRLIRKPKPFRKRRAAAKLDFPRTAYAEKTATRRAYGNALLSLGRVNPSVVAIDGDVKNSTYADAYFEAFPERAFQSYIAEQNMVGVGMGLAAKGYLPFMATFAAFLTRAHDQVRMAAYSFSNIKLCGSHVGVSIGEDGPSQMGLEDLAMFRPIPGCVVLYPSDAVSSEACVAAVAAHKGLAYIRTSRPATPIVYPADETFPIGGSKVLRKGQGDAVTVIAAGITVHEALKAFDLLKKEGLGVRVIDAYSVEPLDANTIVREVAETGSRAVVVEDHFPAGGLGEAVAQALAGRAVLKHLCIRDLPRSGKPDELLERFGISAAHIARAARELLGR
ncbi:MAG TPA: transketolase [Candidatus Aminicenantes bacterium]|nr:transketolase [Candidatus Aminicenantes bacterium]HDT13061.1 transketolase [Candidatus Aminicenantes bacterium]